jgi:hypothetical protein
MVLKALKKNGDLPIHRISASSSIAYAYGKRDGDYVGAALAEATELNKTIRRYI